jgi:hypothetical protein
MERQLGPAALVLQHLLRRLLQPIRERPVMRPDLAVAGVHLVEAY